MIWTATGINDTIVVDDLFSVACRLASDVAIHEPSDLCPIIFDSPTSVNEKLISLHRITTGVCE
jgi:hypothetical protein